MKSVPIKKKFVQDYFHKGIRSNACYSLINLNKKEYKVRTECDEWENLSEGDKLTVIKDWDGLIISKSFLKGHLFVDLFIFLIELFGLFWFFRKFYQKYILKKP